jgi:glycosyltransferase involved in cell wall biosynthesis
MMEVHQIVVAASPGDAVTNAALAYQQILQRVGPSGLFARYVDPRLDGRVFPLPVYESCAHPDDVLIYHASIGEPEVLRFLLNHKQRLVLVYHNITPAEYFAPHDPAFAALLTAGRNELAALRERVDLTLAVSRFNAEELVALGFRDVRVSPLPVNPRSLKEVAPDENMVEHLDQLEGPLVLFVGQILPHKRPDLLLHAYHILSTYLLPEANLAMLGPTRLAPYHEALLTQARELGLRYAVIPGWLTLEELVAFYRRASVFATMTEHEGVCVPLLEAMSFDVPVLARDYAAIPETIGDAGLVLPPGDDPALVAEALALLITENSARSTLIGRGRRRLAAFDPDDAGASFLSHLGSII